MKKRFASLLSVILIVSLLLTGCGDTPADEGGTPAVGDEAYESQTITVTGADLKEDLTITVAELRTMEQHYLDASYKRTTGLYEEFEMEGPYLTEVFEKLGIDLSDYAAIGVEGTDSYYCLVTADIIESTPDLMIALTIDGQSVLGEDKAPAMLAVQGQFGPYWVKMINRITLYTEIPEKVISSVWLFDNLVEGIEPYYYEYYGSKDAAIDFAQIMSRFDNVNSESFLTMKSSDGFLKNETLNMVNHGYYIKYEGEDAPTNVAANIQLGMNVQNISWFSTNADAVIFPEELSVYMDTKTIGSSTGLPLSEILFETGVKQLTGVMFDVLGTNGEKVTVDGEALYDAILVSGADGTHSVIWEPELGFENIPDLMRVRVSSETAPSGTEDGEDEKDDENDDKEDDEKDEPKNDVKGPDDILTITGSGVDSETYWSLSEIKALGSVGKTSYSAVNNWPTRKTFYADGVSLGTLLDAAGLNVSYGSITLTASDGVYTTLTFGQALNSLWSYPNIASSSSSGAFRVPAILAWSCYESTEAASESSKLRCVIGQHGVNDVNTSAWLSDVVKIEVSSSGYYAWSEPSLSLTPGEVPSGSLLSFSTDNINRVKIYYTTDGSTPTYSSSVYNPSTTYYQPELTVPITIDRDMTVKILISGWGRPDSDIFSYSFTIAAPSDGPTDEPGAEDPGTQEPGTETPGTEESGTQDPGTEEPNTPAEPSGSPDEGAAA